MPYVDCERETEDILMNTGYSKSVHSQIQGNVEITFMNSTEALKPEQRRD